MKHSNSIRIIICCVVWIYCFAGHGCELLLKAIDADFKSDGSEVDAYNKMATLDDEAIVNIALLRIAESAENYLNRPEQLRIYKEMHEKDPTLIEALFGLALVDDSNRELWLKRSIEADSSNAAFFFLAAAEKVRIGVDTEQVLELIGKGARCTRFELPGSFLLFRKHQCFANLSAQHKAYLQMSITLSNNAYSLLRMLDDKYIKPTIVDNDRSSELQKYYASRFYQLVSCSEPRTAMLFIFGRQRLMKSSTALGILDADEQRYRNDLSEMQTLDTGSHVPVMEYLSTCCLGTR